MPITRRLATVLLLPVLLTGLAPPAHAQPYQRVLNGGFDQGKTPWWSSANTPTRIEAGRLCADIPAGTTNPWDAMIGQNDVPLEAGQPYTLRFTASGKAAIRASLQLATPPGTSTLNEQLTLTETPRTFEFTGVSTVASRHAQVSFQAGGATAPYTLCLDDISLTGGVIPPGGGWTYGSAVRVNQHGYPADGRKQASIVDKATQPKPWQVRDAAGAVVASGQTRVHGQDAASRDHVHLADFSALRTLGTGYTLAVGDQVSLPFDLLARPYENLRRDALHYFFHNRSGIPIEAAYVGAAHARPAGHLDIAPNRGDTAVPCLPGTCDYSLDVRGGWYDAGDHGKYVVNGALAAWQLLDLYERSRSRWDATGLRDGLLRIPEQRNGVPDVLDEARWQLEFLLRMQVPAGKPLAGMAHHKIHDLAWTGHPMLPHLDPQPRYLHPPSTAATLNLAAAAARCARIWTTWDKAFAQRCRTAADTAWRAARAHPDRFAPKESVGGGPYDDTEVADEFSWAAAELHATTGDPGYLRHLGSALTPAGFSWRDTAALTDLTILRHPQRFPVDRVAAARQRVRSVADGLVRAQGAQGYPNTGEYVWGSTSSTANNAVIIATAFDLTGEARYRDAVLGALDYLLGRNALNQSFVTGYGERDSRNQHHRHWANQADPTLPNPPSGSLAGGPNPSLEDPVAQQNLPGCAPAKCYIDDIGSYSTNEVAINWNSALAWVTAFADTR
ncbi:glycoside hydrolase family 9 protein [Crossiella sp. SN42]|uniref:glycoside hydrolase family 9 protein n=1 Tax=Crossiella sp. SN42 TaxID=2944808 RepID=UPI00207CB2B6|nr:glycoside hydrolase family 9 protein [Crossiella sp. SN42]MCO1576826.1 glycoside hydrolase family 9 protein [Crossiella sp. SN42]